MKRNLADPEAGITKKPKQKKTSSVSRRKLQDDISRARSKSSNEPVCSQTFIILIIVVLLVAVGYGWVLFRIVLPSRQIPAETGIAYPSDFLKNPPAYSKPSKPLPPGSLSKSIKQYLTDVREKMVNSKNEDSKSPTQPNSSTPSIPDQVSELFESNPDLLKEPSLPFTPSPSPSDGQTSEVPTKLSKTLEDFKSNFNSRVESVKNNSSFEGISTMQALGMESKRPWVQTGTGLDPQLLNESETLAAQRRMAVVEEFKFAWKGYKEYSWGYDDLKPLGRKGGVWFKLGTTIIDAMSTIVIMQLGEEYQEGLDWLKNNFNIHRSDYQSLFEFHIRIFGGLVSAYNLTNEPTFKELSEIVAKRIPMAFSESLNGMPYSDYSFSAKSGRLYPWRSNQVYLAEVGSFGVEFREYSHMVGDDRLKTISDGIYDKLLEMSENKIAPTDLKPKSMTFSSSLYTFGGRADSFYEYLIKQYVQTRHTEPIWLERFDNYMLDGIDKLIRFHSPTGLFVSGLLARGSYSYEMDELGCFAPGMFILAAHHTDNNELKLKYEVLAKELMYTCYMMWQSTPTKLAPETTIFDTTITSKSKNYLLRPETLESLYYLHYFTRDPIYREWGWDIFEAIKRNCKNDIGYAAFANVDSARDGHLDEMPSYFFSETLKYAYLLFSPVDTLDLNDWVFNTEGHPLKAFTWDTAYAR